MESSLDLLVNGSASRVALNEESLVVTTVDSSEVCIATDDIIVVSEVATPVDAPDPATSAPESSPSFTVHYIDKLNNPIWTNKSIVITASTNSEQLHSLYLSLRQISDKNIAKRPKRLLVLLNPISGKKQSQYQYDTVVLPLLELSNISVDLKVSERPKHMTEIITEYDCSTVDGIMMLGGDGTFAEIVEVLWRKAQEEAGIDINNPKAELKPLAKPVTLVPTGTGSGKTYGISGCMDVRTTVLHVIKGNVSHNSMMTCYCGEKYVGLSGVVIGTLRSAEMMDLADSQLRWMRHLRYLVLPFYMILKSFYTVPIEVTVYTNETVENNGGTQQIVQKVETFTHDCFMSIIFPCNFVKLSKSDFTSENMSLMCYKPMSRYNFFTNLIKLMTISGDTFENPDIVTYRGHAFRMRVLGTPEMKSDYKSTMVMIDGEIHRCADSDFYIRYERELVKVYSSLPPK